MRAFGMDLRVRIFDACQAGGTTAEVAEQFAVSTAFVRRLKQRHRENGSIGPKPGGRGRTPVLAADEDTIRQAVAAHPHRTPAEHRHHMGLKVSVSTVARTLRRLGLTRKKSRSGRPSGIARTSRSGGPSGRAYSPG